MGAKKILKENKKHEKSVYGIMIYDVLPRKNTKHDIPIFQRKLFIKNGTKRNFTWLSTQLSLVCASSIENF
jgi:hypothetical protein